MFTSDKMAEKKWHLSNGPLDCLSCNQKGHQISRGHPLNGQEIPAVVKCTENDFIHHQIKSNITTFQWPITKKCKLQNNLCNHQQIKLKNNQLNQFKNHQMQWLYHQKLNNFTKIIFIFSSPTKELLEWLNGNQRCSQLCVRV